MKTNFRTMLLFSAAVISATGSAAFAQDAKPAAAEQSAPSDIVVTAQRRSENIQNIATAITALSGDKLAQSGVTVLRDLQTAAPAITFTKAGPTDSVNIRGIGLSSTSANVANGVATYVDGLFQPPIAQGVELYDIKARSSGRIQPAVRCSSTPSAPNLARWAATSIWNMAATTI